MDPNEKLTTNQVAEEFKMSSSTLRSWRQCRGYDKRYPRFHKLFTGKVFYIRGEFVEDLKRMEVEEDSMHGRRGR